MGSVPGSEDPLQEEMATHSSILAWEISQRSLAGYSPCSHRVRHYLVTKQQQHCIINLKVAKSIDVKCSHHKKKEW